MTKDDLLNIEQRFAVSSCGQPCCQDRFLLNAREDIPELVREVRRLSKTLSDLYLELLGHNNE